jgi:5,5'-dehydrodivanillate O-demethylase
VLTLEQNEALTHVLPGTRMGHLMRRYWHPVAARAELDANSLKPITLLGESLVLFRDKNKRLGLLDDACPHRGSSLAHGIPEDRGLRCSSHGWLFASDGSCLEQPVEPPDSKTLREARSTAHPVQELGGLIFAYLGPEPRPLLPRYDVLVWDDAVREINGSIIGCNWLQVMENLLDPMHVEQLHGEYFAYVLDRKGGSQAQEFAAHYRPPPMKKIGFDRFDHGVIERHVVRDEEDASWRTGTPSFFPTTSLVGSLGRRGSIIFIVPIDDTHTWFLLEMADRTGVPVAQGSVPFSDVPGLDAVGNFVMDTANGQDHMAVVTQGDVARRQAEHLCASDAGIVLYRQMLVEQMERLEGGKDPMNVRRDAAENRIIEPPSVGDPQSTAGWSRQRKRWAARHAHAARV